MNQLASDSTITNKVKKQKNRKHSISFANETSLTEQSHKAACDIHNIMRQSQKTGMINHLAQHEGQYMDLANRPTFQEANNIIAKAKSTFETVPAKIREQFHNDPGEFLEFIQTPENRAQMLEMGFSDAHLPAVEAEPVPILVKMEQMPHTEADGD
jgi:phage internal scaffolding protein